LRETRSKREAASRAGKRTGAAIVIAIHDNRGCIFTAGLVDAKMVPEAVGFRISGVVVSCLPNTDIVVVGGDFNDSNRISVAALVGAYLITCASNSERPHSVLSAILRDAKKVIRTGNLQSSKAAARG